MTDEVFDDLFLSYMENILPEEKLSALREELKSSPAHLKEFLGLMSLHAMLQCQAGFVQPAKPMRPSRWLPLVAAAAGLALLLAGGSTFFLRRAPATQNTQLVSAGRTKIEMAEPQSKDVRREVEIPPPAVSERHEHALTPVLDEGVTQSASSGVTVALETRQRKKHEMKTKNIALAAAATAVLALASTQPRQTQVKSEAAAFGDSEGISLNTRLAGTDDIAIQDLETRVRTYKDSTGMNLKTTKFRGFVIMLK